MSESRILVIDADRTRGERIGTILDFMDLTPRVVTDADELHLNRHDPQDWLAVVLGEVPDERTWKAFLDWLKRDPLHPPILALPEHHLDGAADFGLNEANFWPLDYPIKQPQLVEFLRRASIKKMEEIADVGLPKGGPRKPARRTSAGSPPRVPPRSRPIWPSRSTARGIRATGPPCISACAVGPA